MVIFKATVQNFSREDALKSFYCVVDGRTPGALAFGTFLKLLRSNNLSRRSPLQIVQTAVRVLILVKSKIKNEVLDNRFVRRMMPELPESIVDE